MNPSGQYIFDVSMSDFQRKVIDGSSRTPVVVDFHAEWCGPCKVLGPLLEKIVSSYNGKMALAKVDIDKNPQLADMFGIHSVPSVKIFVDGQVADEFTGLMPETDIRAILDSLGGDETEQLLEHASRLAADDHIEEAESVYAGILAKNPENSAARIGLARVKIAQGEDDDARALLAAVGTADSRFDEARSLLALFDFFTVCEHGGGFEACRTVAEKAPEDLEARYTLGCCHIAHDRFTDAMDLFLSIVAKDRGFGEGKAQKAMLALFTVLGRGNETAEEYRKKLAMVLF
jgi:putative thioredoxin